MSVHIKKVENGATLIITMIFLLILTIIGLAGMDVTGLEERMAGNMRDRNMAFQAAEAAILDGERYIEEDDPDCRLFNDSSGLYTSTGNGDKRWEIIDWSSSAAVINYSGFGFDELNSRSAYILEYLTDIPDDDGLGLGRERDYKCYYRVTARSEGVSDSASVILQTVYKH